MPTQNIPQNSVWTAMSYIPPRGRCNYKTSLMSPACSCLRFMLHPVKAATSFECDGCNHHASFHSMENAAEDAVVKKWAAAQEVEEQAKGGAGVGRKRRRIAEVEAVDVGLERREVLEIEDGEDTEAGDGDGVLPVGTFPQSAKREAKAAGVGATPAEKPKRRAGRNIQDWRLEQRRLEIGHASNDLL